MEETERMLQLNILALTDLTHAVATAMAGRGSKTAPRKRDQAMKIVTKLPQDFPVQDLVRASRLSVGLDILKPRSWLSMLRLGLATL
jgi:hypothetical protein